MEHDQIFILGRLLGQLFEVELEQCTGARGNPGKRQRTTVLWGKQAGPRTELRFSKG